MNEPNDSYMALGLELMRRCHAGDTTEDIHGWLQARLTHMVGLDTGGDGLLAWEETFGFYDSILSQREEYANMDPALRKELLWPWASWNNYIDPLPPGFLAVVAAGDGQGKTLYAEMIAEEWAKRTNKVVFVHFELNHSVMLDRRYVRHTGMTIRDLKKGNLSPEQRKNVEDAHAKLREWDGGITYQHSAGWTMEKTVDRLRQLKREGKCDVVVIDYLEKSAPSQKQIQLYGNSQNQREADNVEWLKNFGEQSETPILMLAQMNKSSKSSGIDNVDRTGIRGAGEKTEKANLVILLNRQWDEGKKTYSQYVDIRVDKNTIGPTCAFQQLMIPEFFRVHDLAED